MRAICVSAVGVCLAAAVVVAQAQPPPLAFTHVTLIDGSGSPAQTDMTVVVSGNTISQVGRSADVKLPANARQVDARNQFMIPGLWDLHTHPFMRKNKMLPLLGLQLFIANGITGIRDMGDQGVPDDFGDMPYVQDVEWRQAVAGDAVIGPRMNVAGVIVDAGANGR